jgi:hypothetical protein
MKEKKTIKSQPLFGEAGDTLSEDKKTTSMTEIKIHAGSSGLSR